MATVHSTDPAAEPLAVATRLGHEIYMLECALTTIEAWDKGGDEQLVRAAETVLARAIAGLDALTGEIEDMGRPVRKMREVGHGERI
jgi:hypothetical protein